MEIGRSSQRVWWRNVFTSLRQLDYDQKTTIYYNVDFPGINKDALDEDNLKGARRTFLGYSQLI